MRKLAITVISVLPIVVFLLPMLLSGGDTLFGGDFDMQVQMTEAARISIVEFGQFPFWNPWVAGGVPLFADPQFGLVTPQTFFSFFVPSAYAWKLTILTYFIVGFLSMRALLLHLTGDTGRKKLIATLVSYLWVFGSFFTLRATAGHFTLLLLTLLPLAIYLYLNVTKSKKYVVLLTALLAYCLNASTHFSTILIFLTLYTVAALMFIIGVIQGHEGTAAPETLRSRLRPELWKILWLVVATLIAVVLNGYRIYQTLEYMNDFKVDRSGDYEQFLGFRAGIDALFQPFGTYEITEFHYGGFEASNYIGTITGILLVLLLVSGLFLIARDGKTLNLRGAKFTVLAAFSIVAVLSFAIGLAGVPFALLRELPVMSSMRVSTRYLLITAFSLLVITGLLLDLVVRRKVLGKHSFVIFTAIATLAVAQVYYHTFTYQVSLWTNDIYLLHSSAENRVPVTSPPKAYKNWESATPPEYQGYAGRYWSQNHALTYATQNNVDQIIADNALVDTRSILTQRCDESEEGCSYVLTDNATVTKWSPNKIELERTGTGIIQLNVNQGAHWMVNGKYIFPHQKVVNSNSTFTIPDDNEDTYVIEYVPWPSFLK